MAARSKSLKGTALVVAAPAPVVVNAARKPDPSDPHSLLELIGDPSGSEGVRVMYGVLRGRHGGLTNSASSFLAAKLRPSWSPDEHAITAAWAEALAPADADDSFADPVLLAARIDCELARDAAGDAPLWAYATITDPGADRIHVFRDELRGVARDLVARFGGPIVAIVHAPGRARSGNPLHGHLLMGPVVVDGPLGFSTRIAPLCGPRGRQTVLDAWHGRRRLV